MSEAWRNTYDAWKLQSPPWYDHEDEDDTEEIERAWDAEMQRREDRAREDELDRRHDAR